MFGIPVDSARASFILNSSTVGSKEEFQEILEAFYVHLYRGISGETQESLDGH
jgi:hypothetical protein